MRCGKGDEGQYKVIACVGRSEIGRFSSLCDLFVLESRSSLFDIGNLPFAARGTTKYERAGGGSKKKRRESAVSRVAVGDT